MHWVWLLSDFKFNCPGVWGWVPFGLLYTTVCWHFWPKVWQFLNWIHMFADIVLWRCDTTQSGRLQSGQNSLISYMNVQHSISRVLVSRHVASCVLVRKVWWMSKFSPERSEQVSYMCIYTNERTLLGTALFQDILYYSYIEICAATLRLVDILLNSWNIMNLYTKGIMSIITSVVTFFLK
jgi:hypothetical protein